MSTTIYSLYRIEILQHFYLRPRERFENEGAPGFPIEVQNLIDVGALQRNADGSVEITPLGRAWIYAICRTPLPRAAFVDAAGNVLTP